MNYGLNDADWQILLTVAIEPLKSVACDVWIFGSRARGDYRKFSDVDLCYCCKNPLPGGLLTYIKELMETSNLTIKVDLVNTQDLAVDYRPSIDKEKIKL